MATDAEDNTADVLRTIWQAQGQDARDLEDDSGPQKACKNMKDVSFDGFAPPGSDLAQAWRDKLAREGKLGEGSLRDLVVEDTADPGSR